jgi:hypothetical protein
MTDYPTESYDVAFVWLLDELEAIRQMLSAFSSVSTLRLAEQAEALRRQVDAVTDLYFHETWDSQEELTSAFDMEFSKLECDSEEFGSSIARLSDALVRFRTIYRTFVLPQCIVLLVSAWETYLRSVFECCLRHQAGSLRRSAEDIYDRPTFQSWGFARTAFRLHLDIHLGGMPKEEEQMVQLVQQRNRLVHEHTPIREQPVGTRRKGRSTANDQMLIREAEVDEGLDLVLSMAKHVRQAVHEKMYQAQKPGAAVFDDPPVRR